MPSTLPPEAAGPLALAALLLLPGLLVVRAPWTTVPALSLAFWALGWWWLPLGARSRVLAACLVIFVVLALFRLLPRHVVPPPPGYTGPVPPPPVTGPTSGDVPRVCTLPSLAVVGVALVLLGPLPFEHHAPGSEMAFHTTSARLVLWRDGVPATYKPLLPVGPFGSHSPALPTLAGDLARLAGLDPARAVVVLVLVSHGLLVVGLFALLSALGLRPSGAALGAIVGPAAVPWPSTLAMWGAGGPTLSLALGLSAGALLLGHKSRPSAAAAGMLLGAAALAQPLLALLVGVALTLVVQASPAGRGDPRWARQRLAVAFLVAVGLAAPGLFPLAGALSVGEARGVLQSLRLQEIADSVTGLVLVSLVALLVRALGDGTPRVRILNVALGIAGAVVLVGRVHGELAAGQLLPESRRALSHAAEASHPLESICGPPALVDWVPALGGRAAGAMDPQAPRPWVPHTLREELAESPPPPCTRNLDPSGSRRP